VTTDHLSYSVRDAARRAGIGRDGIYAAIRERRLVARKLGRRTLILAADLASFLAALPPLQLAKQETERDPRAERRNLRSQEGRCPQRSI
jgi:excisionase family DNA binding protein